jgi:hypothetical protein
VAGRVKSIALLPGCMVNAIAEWVFNKTKKPRKMFRFTLQEL